MKKQTKQIVVLVALCVIMVAALIVLKTVNNKSEAQEEEEAVITLKTISVDDITQFSYLLNGENYSYTKQGEEWIYDGDTSLNLDESEIESMLDSITTIQAEEELTDVEDLSEYGLTEPFETITVKTAEQTVTIYVGDYNTIVSTYYFMLDDSPNVYTYSGGFCEAFQSMPQDLVAEEEESVSDNSVVE